MRICVKVRSVIGMRKADARWAFFGGGWGRLVRNGVVVLDKENPERAIPNITNPGACTGWPSRVLNNAYDF